MAESAATGYGPCRSGGDTGGSPGRLFTGPRGGRCEEAQVPPPWRGPQPVGGAFPPEVAAPRGVVVVIHGGYWRSQYGAELGEPTGQGPRRARDGRLEPENTAGPATAEAGLTRLPTSSAEIDKLRELAAEHGLGLDKVLGHSAGGHLAVWAAGRSRLAGLGAPEVDRQLTRRGDDDGAVHLPASWSHRGAQPGGRRAAKP